MVTLIIIIRHCLVVMMALYYLQYQRQWASEYQTLGNTIKRLLVGIWLVTTVHTVAFKRSIHHAIVEAFSMVHFGG